MEQNNQPDPAQRERRASIKNEIEKQAAEREKLQHQKEEIKQFVQNDLRGEIEKEAQRKRELLEQQDATKKHMMQDILAQLPK